MRDPHRSPSWLDLLDPLLEPVERATNRGTELAVAGVRSMFGDRGCFIALVLSALLAFILGVVLRLDGELLLVLAVALALFVFVVGSVYRLGAGSRSGSNNQVDSDRRKATSGPELITRYQAGERDFRQARLRWAVLLNADLNGVDLSGADLRGAELDGAALQEAILSDASLRNADLQRANLTGANLVGANLAGVNLIDANVSNRQLAQAASLKGATLPDGTVHD